MTYAERIAPLALPTHEQTRAFAEHVADNHSWYKHLPFFPPGAGLVFFLNPHAGRGVEPAGGGFTLIDLDRGDYFRHHSSLATAAYRERFGCWDYWVDDNPRMSAPVEGPWLYNADGGRELLPDDLKRRWSCRLTAYLKVGPMLCADAFQTEQEAFGAYARQRPTDPGVVRYGAIAREPAASPAERAFAFAEAPLQLQLVLLTLCMVRDDCARMHAPGA